VNGVKASLGTKADATKDTIMVDQQILPKVQPQQVYIALHKPRGILSDVDPNDSRPTVMDLVPKFGHLFAVGRLDLDSEGLILLTNDGELANRLTHPRYGHEKEYRVYVGNRPDEEQLSIWRRGVVLADGHKTLPAQVTVESVVGEHTWLRVIMKEGRKRQIREVGSTIGVPVLRIMRVRIGTLELGSLKPREWRELRSEEIKSLKSSVGDPHPTHGPRKFDRRPARAGGQPARKPGRATGRPSGGSDRGFGGNSGSKSDRRTPRPYSSSTPKAAHPVSRTRRKNG
jgi:23S rRNA pseudouridine2605 synthase